MNPEHRQNDSAGGGAWRPLILIGLVVAMIIVSSQLDLGTYLEVLREWIQGLGPLGAVVYIAIYVIATVAALPGLPLSVLAGAIFGAVVGVAVVSVGATLGAALSFLVGRYFARDATAAWLSRSEKFRKLDSLTEKHGATIVALTRLVPIFPFNLLNYGFGLTRIRFGTYVFWSWLCMLPGIVLYVAGADLLTQLAAGGELSPTVIVGVLVAAAVLFLLARYARGRLEA